MKKKTISIVAVIALLATALIGGSLAYFTDTDEATNQFTAGNVDITLIEQQRNDERTALEDFEQNKTLMPIVGSAQGEKDGFGQPVAKNYVDKMVTIKNEGKSDAYIRAYFAIPSDLDDGYENFNAGANVLHFNFGNKDGQTTYEKEWKWMHGDKWNYFETTIDGVKYNVYFADYATTVKPNETTAQFVSGVYLDKSVDQKDGKWYAFGEELTLAGDTNMNNIKCPVFAVAVQADGFGSAADAVKDAFGANYNPFGGEATNWQ